MIKSSPAKKPSGFIIYRGPSMLDGSPIVAVAITKSENVKTGNMIQTYILVDNDKSPVENVKALADSAICGNCKHRRGTGGACYVNLGQGPRAVADGVVRGIYPHNAELARLASKDRIVRLGTYGDPAAVPVSVWTDLLALSAGRTGYTHQWQNPAFAPLLELVMASADSEQERKEAKALGFRTFRIRSSDEEIMKGEYLCPASEEAGKRKTCAECTACDGGTNNRKADPVIIVHGSLKNRFIAIKSI